MARLIDADELVSKINKLDIFYFIGETDIAVHDCQMVELGAVLSEIDEAPTVDAVPVVHGRWDTIAQKTVSRLSRCSACGFEKYNIHWCNHCPNCGAKMDLEVE